MALALSHSRTLAASHNRRSKGLAVGVHSVAGAICDLDMKGPNIPKYNKDKRTNLTR